MQGSFDANNYSTYYQNKNKQLFSLINEKCTSKGFNVRVGIPANNQWWFGGRLS